MREEGEDEGGRGRGSVRSEEGECRDCTDYKAPIGIFNQSF